MNFEIADKKTFDKVDQFSSPNLQDLEQIISTLLSEGKCACHFINPHKTRILMWKQEKDGKITYHLRIGIQKFISSEQIDRNGETYWRYYSFESKVEETKEFNQRQEKTEVINHGKSDNLEQSINSSTS